MKQKMSLKINQHIYGQLVFKKIWKQFNRKKFI